MAKNKHTHHKRISLWSLDYMVNEAIRYLQSNEPEHGYFVGFSGGKDSIVTEKLCQMAGVRYRVGYSFTGIDPPEVVKFTRQYYPDVEFFFPRMTFWNGIRKKMPPLKMRRWCCDLLKKEPTKGVRLPRVTGIRKEESPKRSERPRTEYHDYFKEWQFKPIFYFTEWHLWGFIEEHDLPYPELYDEGFNRIGCVICPFIMNKNQGMLNKHMQRWPRYYKIFERVVAEWFNTNRRFDKDVDIHSAEQYIKEYYKGFDDLRKAETTADRRIAFKTYKEFHEGEIVDE